MSFTHVMLNDIMTKRFIQDGLRFKIYLMFACSLRDIMRILIRHACMYHGMYVDVDYVIGK